MACSEEFSLCRTFLLDSPKLIEGGNSPYQAIYSLYFAEISRELIETAERNIRDKKNLPTEGLFGVFTLEQLANSPRREFSTAHATAHILNWRFGSNIPHPGQ